MCVVEGMPKMIAPLLSAASLIASDWLSYNEGDQARVTRARRWWYSSMMQTPESEMTGQKRKIVERLENDYEWRG